MNNRALQRFVKKHSTLEQGSTGWTMSFATTIGGSEMAAVMGMNPYSTMEDIIANKIDMANGIVKELDSVDCWWGKLFEDVIKRYVEIELDTKIIGDKICITSHKGIRCSPDGYADIKVSGNKIISIDDDYDADEVHTILFEFKCPTKRRPIEGQIPKHYKPQIWLGLALTPYARYGVFVDAVFRRCELDDLGFNPEYNDSYHKLDNSFDHRILERDPIACGMIGIYSVEGRIDIIDAGKIDDRSFYHIMKKIDNKTYKVWMSGIRRHGDVFGVDEQAEIIEECMDNAPENYKMYGFIPWKLFEIIYVPMVGRPGMIETATELAEIVHARVRASLNIAS